MALVALDGTPLVRIGAANRNGLPSLTALSSTLIDAANEACIMIGHVFTSDGASHTINTTGSSSLGWRTGAVTFANAGTTVKVGLGAVDASTGPSPRAVNVADVITSDVAAVFTGGGGGITATAWQTSVPTTGTKTIANGDLVAFTVQATARAGADAINVNTEQALGVTMGRPAVTNFTGAVYADKTALPNCVITFSDGAKGYFYGGFVASVATSNQQFNSGSSPNEYGNLFQLGFPAKCYGLYFGAAVAGDLQVILYSDPLGTPVAEKTISIDLNQVGGATGGLLYDVLFPAPYSMAASTAYAAVFKPTTVTNITTQFKTYNAAADQASDFPGSSTNGYAINRSSGAFAAQNSNLDRFTIGLLVGAFDAGGGGTAGASRSRVQVGM